MYFLQALPRNFIRFRHRKICKWRDSKSVFEEFPRISHFHCSSRRLRNNDFSINEEFDYSQNLGSRCKADYDAITGGNSDKLKLLNLLLMELETMYQSGRHLPEIIATKHWQTLLSLTNQERDSYLNHLLNIERIRDIKENEKLKNRVYFNDQNCSKGLFCETITEHIPMLYNYKLLKAMVDGPHIIIDCSCEQFTPRTTIWKTAYYMFEAWVKNRIFLNPCNIIFCDMNFNGELYESFMELFSSLKLDPAVLLNCTEKSHLDLFPKNQLLYLSSYAKTNMEAFNSNKVYIIGALFSPNIEITRIKEKRKNGISFLKLPHQEYENLSGWRNEVTLPDYIQILNNVKEGCSWDVALRPLRKNQSLDSSYYNRKIKRYKTQIHDKFRKDLFQNLND